MERKKLGAVDLFWVREGKHYELKKDPKDKDERCVARVMSPDSAFDEKDYHFVIYHPDRTTGHVLYGHAASFDAAIAMAEVSVSNKGWWGGKKASFNNRPTVGGKLERKLVRR